jgi:3-carboxy-cis,cis-muconate cycloisomerase
MPQKRNPSGVVLLRAAASAGRARAGELLLAGPHEHQRAAGAWQAEWASFSDVLSLAGTCAERAASVFASLEVHPDRMLANLERSGGLLFADRIAAELERRLPGGEGTEIVARLVDRAISSRGSFRGLVASDPRVGAAANPDAIASWFDSATSLGSARELVDLALARFDRAAKR